MIYKSAIERCKEYYYLKILENGIKYDKNNCETDFINASYYFRFFVAIWFGTIDEDELINKNKIIYVINFLGNQLKMLTFHHLFHIQNVIDPFLLINIQLKMDYNL